MMIVLLIAGIGGVLAGIVAILLGLPVKEFSFGNTLILAGVVGVCTGVIVLALAVVVGELRNVARRLGARAAAEARSRPALASAPGAPPAFPDASDDEFSFSREPARDEPEQIEAATPNALAWRGDAMAPPRGRPEPASTPEAAGPAPGPKQRRNLMFSSTSRKERERAQTRPPDPSPPDLRRAPPVAPLPEPAETPPASFDDAWPKPERASDRGRPAELPAPRRANRSPSPFSSRRCRAISMSRRR
jgi:hypothetical protein